MLMQNRRRTACAIAAALLLCILVPDPTAASVSYTYDLAGRVTTAVYDNGTCVAYAYDAAGNRTSQINTVSGAPVTPTWGTGTWGCFVWTPH
jgi:YD repeat-containing protein